MITPRCIRLQIYCKDNLLFSLLPARPRHALSLGLAGVRGESQVGLFGSDRRHLLLPSRYTHVDSFDVVAEELLNLLALDRGVDDDVVSLVPVG